MDLNISKDFDKKKEHVSINFYLSLLNITVTPVDTNLTTWVKTVGDDGGGKKSLL